MADYVKNLTLYRESSFDNYKFPCTITITDSTSGNTTGTVSINTSGLRAGATGWNESTGKLEIIQGSHSKNITASSDGSSHTGAWWKNHTNSFNLGWNIYSTSGNLTLKATATTKYFPGSINSSVSSSQTYPYSTTMVVMTNPQGGNTGGENTGSTIVKGYAWYTGNRIPA